tara:strand:+ start:825 stop:1235 length:411 start_codon:yes stop_codon:yes gene_type:complete
MSRKIKKISILFEGERIFIEATRYGKFKIPVIRKKNGHSKTVNKMMTAREVIENERIKFCDPTLTLENGEKIRVFQGGDPTYMLTEASSIIDMHEELSIKRNNLWIDGLKKKKTTNHKSKTIVPDYDIFEDISDWY